MHSVSLSATECFIMCDSQRTKSCAGTEYKEY